jgi:hypothetical protein
MPCESNSVYIYVSYLPAQHDPSKIAHIVDKLLQQREVGWRELSLVLQVLSRYRCRLEGPDS